MARIYLDYNATTPVAPEVFEAMRPFLTTEFGNPSSAHPEGQRARRAVEEARTQVAALAGALPEQVVFTSGGTEATHLALLGLATRDAPRRRIVTTAVEHPATLGPCARLRERGYDLEIVPATSDGRVDVRTAADAIDESTLFVSVMHANNETGAILPVNAIAAHAHGVGAVVHCDAAQSAGKIAIDDLDADLLTIAGHKLYAPKGVGALVIKGKVALQSLLLGGGQERGLRPGTENVASIVGLGAAAAMAMRESTTRASKLESLCAGLLWRLRASVPGLSLNGPEHERLPNTANVSFPGVSGAALLSAAERLSASTGSACHAGQSAVSPVLAAMGVSAERAQGAVRLSVGTPTTEAEIEEAAKLLADAFERLTSS